MNIFHKKEGFTLIELLVVIAIIGMLSAVILASLSKSHARGRDAKRVADLNQLRLALQLYYDANQSYPSTAGNADSSSVLGALTTSGAIAVLPIDPLSTNHYYYQPATFSNGTYTACSSACSSYVLAAQLESDATSLNGYQGNFGILGHNCNQPTSPNFIYCVTP